MKTDWKCCPGCETYRSVEENGYCFTCNQPQSKQPKVHFSKKPPKITNERAVHLEIWAERKHFCDQCGIKLGNTPLPIYFSHIKPKSTHPKLRLEKSNFQLHCAECHDAYEFRGREAFDKRKGIDQRNAPPQISKV